MVMQCCRAMAEIFMDPLLQLLTCEKIVAGVSPRYTESLSPKPRAYLDIFSFPVQTMRKKTKAQKNVKSLSNSEFEMKLQSSCKPGRCIRTCYLLEETSNRSRTRAGARGSHWQATGEDVLLQKPGAVQGSSRMC